MKKHTTIIILISLVLLAVTSFYVFNDQGVNSQVNFAIDGLNRLMSDFFALLHEA